MTGTMVDLAPVRARTERSWVARQARFAVDELQAHPGRFTAILAMAGAVFVAAFVLGAPMALTVAPTPSMSQPSAAATTARPGVPTPRRHRAATGPPTSRRTSGVRPVPAAGTAPAAPQAAATRPRSSASPSAGPTSPTVIAPSTRTMPPPPTCPPTGCV